MNTSTWKVRGQDQLVRALEVGLSLGRLSHAYLFVGPKHIGKKTLALDLARAVNCLQENGRPCLHCDQCVRISAFNHADVRVIDLSAPDGTSSRSKEIGIDVIREIKHQVILKPFEGRYRVFIFDGAENLSEEAANALLKTLEEPPQQVLIILLTAWEDAVLPTILSRCQRLMLRLLPKEQVVRELVEHHSVADGAAERLARLSRGCLGWAITALNDPEVLSIRNDRLEVISSMTGADLENRFSYAAELSSQYFRERDDVREILYLWLGWWRDILLLGQGAEEYIQNLDFMETLSQQAEKLTLVQKMHVVRSVCRTLDVLEHNVNPRLALEVMMLALPGTERHLKE